MEEGGVLEEEDCLGARVTVRPDSFFSYLAALLERSRLAVLEADAAGLPFNFWGGLVGCLGYELKAECGGRRVHASPTPDAAFLLADRLVALDHQSGDAYVLSMYEGGTGSSGGGSGVGEGGVEAVAWVDETASELEHLADLGHRARASSLHECSSTTAAVESLGGTLAPLKETQLGFAGGTTASAPKPCRPCSPAVPTACDASATIIVCCEGSGAVVPSPPPLVPPPFHLRHSREQYMANIETYRQALYDGESYEVCIFGPCLCVTQSLTRTTPQVCATTAFERPLAPDPAALYSTLRRLNPAPYAAWLSFGGEPGE